MANPVPTSFGQVLGSSTTSFSNIVRRAASSDSSEKKSSGPSSITLPIALGVAIPIVFALSLFLWLQRRHVRKLRAEEKNDPHKSLDFGMDPSTMHGKNKSNKKRHDMAVTEQGVEKPHPRGRGLSMDMDLGSPASTRSQSHSRKYADDSSSFADSNSSRRGYINDGMNQNLLKNAQRMSRSMPPTQRSPDGSTALPQIPAPEPAAVVPRRPSPLSSQPSASMPALGDGSRESYMSRDGADFRKSNNYLGALIHSREPSTDILSQPSSQPAAQTKGGLSSAPAATPQQTHSRKSPPPAINTVPQVTRPPRKQSLKATATSHAHNLLDDESDYGDSFNLTPPSPPRAAAISQPQAIPRPRKDSLPAASAKFTDNTDALGLGYNVQRLSMGFRPLPPDDPTDNPEQRANRIRSFYKEYFDESKVGLGQLPPGKYYEDYDENYLGDGGVFDPATDDMMAIQPKRSEPYGRRAMTPPPRAPPRFRGGARHHASTLSSGSGRFGSPKPRLPPPGPLQILPSPHLLKEDSFALPIDFAPPTSYKERQAGRPESPRGGSRPYSPMVSAHLPLASSFDDLSVMPSPHLLRKSGTFTALDFAPPPRFKSSDNGSDTGSIRSNRSAMSAQQLHSIRAGAYRVSRIPKEVVGTKTEITDSLKPSWNMRTN
ncbi:MAG: hypothetical protein Q9208_002945 [Pyrenodesmia sp. 3 TL-2023]